MKKNLTNAFRMMGAVAVFMTVFAIQASKAQSMNEGGGRLEGTWDAQVSITDCQSGAVLRTFPSIGIYFTGGSMMDSTSGIPQALKTPGEGVWRHTQGDAYQIRFKSFSFNAQNVFTGWTIIQHAVWMDQSGNSYISAGTAEVYAPNGILVATGCSTSAATRFGFSTNERVR
ncbi:MAG: hypothetical protein ABJA02_02110 [Acidobacteriota bacterium]